MAAKDGASHLKQQNVDLSTSILDVLVQPVDLSLANATLAVVCGEWVSALGFGEKASRTLTGVEASARCVWAEMGRTDIQATRYTRVPVLYKSAWRAKMYLWHIPDGGDGFVAGEEVALAANEDGRNVIAPLADLVAAGDPGDVFSVVGYCLKTADPADGAISPIECFMYDSPRVFVIPAAE